MSSSSMRRSALGTCKQTAQFMQRKKRQPNFAQSEPEFLISYMDRHQDWAVIVCLVGGGQEINTGEAGIGALARGGEPEFPAGICYISSQLADSEYAAGEALEARANRPSVHLEIILHLAVSMRSFRAENVSAFVKALLDWINEPGARAFAADGRPLPDCPDARSEHAKRWVRAHARGSERYGLVASSKAMRLKPHAIDVRVAVDPGALVPE